ncbi:MAG: BrnT family toxin [bacterium]
MSAFGDGLDQEEPNAAERATLRIRDLIWLEEIVEKLWTKHHVDTSEVREVVVGGPRFRFVEKGHRRGEDVYAALGRTGAGRYLTVFLVLKRKGEALVISARDMTTSERKRYEQG